jgi:hypothetical protein
VSQFDKTSFRASPASLPRTRYGVGRDPWFDRLTTLSEVEGESRKISENKIILDPGSHPAPRDLAGMTNCGAVSDREGFTRHSSMAGRPQSPFKKGGGFVVLHASWTIMPPFRKGGLGGF